MAREHCQRKTVIQLIRHQNLKLTLIGFPLTWLAPDAEYLARDDCNFIIINWLAIQHPPYYRDGVNNTLEAGAHAG